jgi:hypothetical protein
MTLGSKPSAKFQFVRYARDSICLDFVFYGTGLLR